MYLALVPRPFSLVTFIFLFEPKFLKPILQRPECQSQELRRFCDVVICAVHRLHNQAAFDFLKINAFGRQFEKVA